MYNDYKFSLKHNYFPLSTIDMYTLYRMTYNACIVFVDLSGMTQHTGNPANIIADIYAYVAR